MLQQPPVLLFFLVCWLQSIIFTVSVCVPCSLITAFERTVTMLQQPPVLVPLVLLVPLLLLASLLLLLVPLLLLLASLLFLVVILQSPCQLLSVPTSHIVSLSDEAFPFSVFVQV